MLDLFIVLVVLKSSLMTFLILMQYEFRNIVLEFTLIFFKF